MAVVDAASATETVLKTLGIDPTSFETINAILTGSTFSNVLKGLIMLGLLYFSWRIKKWKAKAAAKRSDELSAQAEADNRQSNEQQHSAATQDASAVDDILGDK